MAAGIRPSGDGGWLPYATHLGSSSPRHTSLERHIVTPHRMPLPAEIVGAAASGATDRALAAADDATQAGVGGGTTASTAALVASIPIVDRAATVQGFIARSNATSPSPCSNGQGCDERARTRRHQPILRRDIRWGFQGTARGLPVGIGCASGVRATRVGPVRTGAGAAPPSSARHDASRPNAGCAAYVRARARLALRGSAGAHRSHPTSCGAKSRRARSHRRRSRRRRSRGRARAGVRPRAHADGAGEDRARRQTRRPVEVFRVSRYSSAAVQRCWYASSARVTSRVEPVPTVQRRPALVCCTADCARRRRPAAAAVRGHV